MLITAQEARDFAIKAHGDQKYAGTLPYVTHLDQVKDILRGYGFYEDKYKITAYLHDVLEDTAVTVDDLVYNVPDDVLMAVQFLTDEPGATRKERKDATYRLRGERAKLWRVYDWVPLALRVKLADRLANLRASIDTPYMDMYFAERQDFADAYCIKGICNDMWAEYFHIMDLEERIRFHGEKRH
jgi:(p)ppGpp synthase/HD superfamily hydrolase